jgi:hypothetical protein
MTNILFLDLDGPAFPEVVMRYDPANRKPYPGKMDFGDLTYWKMCERFKNLWAHMFSVYDFEVVISSTWRKHYPKPEYFNDLFAANGLPINLHKDWCTPQVGQTRYSDFQPYGNSYGSECKRASEIFYWLQNHPEVKNFVIIDDDDSGYSLNINGSAWNESHNRMAGNIVLVDIDSGMGSEHIMLMNNIMKRWPLV